MKSSHTSLSFSLSFSKYLDFWFKSFLFFVSFASKCLNGLVQRNYVLKRHHNLLLLFIIQFFQPFIVLQFLSNLLFGFFFAETALLILERNAFMESIFSKSLRCKGTGEFFSLFHGSQHIHSVPLRWCWWNYETSDLKGFRWFLTKFCSSFLPMLHFQCLRELGTAGCAS